MHHNHKLNTYLALGDSYTIGEGLTIQNSFPYQFVQALRKKKHAFAAPEIIAKTGWTTDELAAAIEDYNFLNHYNLVSLLIGVNNQYRGRGIEEYKMQFENLLNTALGLAGGKADHVLVLSIPDYSITPFAKKMDREKISHQIELFNSVCRAVSIQYKTQFIDIATFNKKTNISRISTVQDGLHPTEKEYKKWAAKALNAVKHLLK
jgi:lysophospholipase L1-like esterase